MRALTLMTAAPGSARSWTRSREDGRPVRPPSVSFGEASADVVRAMPGAWVERKGGRALDAHATLAMARLGPRAQPGRATRLLLITAGSKPQKHHEQGLDADRARPTTEGRRVAQSELAP